MRFRTPSREISCATRNTTMDSSRTALTVTVGTSMFGDVGDAVTGDQAVGDVDAGGKTWRAASAVGNLRMPPWRREWKGSRGCSGREDAVRVKWPTRGSGEVEGRIWASAQ